LNKDKAPNTTTTDSANNWISTLQQGVNTGGRHEALVKLASYYFSRLPIDVAAQLIRDWNQKNTPPLNDDELEDQLDDLSHRFESGKYSTNQSQEVTPEDEEIMSMDEVLENVPEPNWIVDNYIPKSGMVLLCGEAEKGKTWVALDLAIELTRGGKWLGQFPTSISKVLYIDEEKPKAFFKKRLRLLGNGKNYKAPKGTLSFSFQKGMKLDRERGIKLFINLLEKHQPDVVILDAFADFLTGKENDVTDILKIYDLLKMMRKKYNTTFIIIDHEKQAMMDRQGNVIINEDYVGNDVRGSKAKRNVVDTQLSFKSIDGQIKVFHSKTSWTIRQKPFIISIDDIVKGESTKIEFKGYV
jgi:RecA-family ATPase